MSTGNARIPALEAGSTFATHHDCPRYQGVLGIIPNKLSRMGQDRPVPGTTVAVQGAIVMGTILAADEGRNSSRPRNDREPRDDQGILQTLGSPPWGFFVSPHTKPADGVSDLGGVMLAETAAPASPDVQLRSTQPRFLSVKLSGRALLVMRVRSYC